jgi:hypothetical protein
MLSPSLEMASADEPITSANAFGPAKVVNLAHAQKANKRQLQSSRSTGVFLLKEYSGPCLPPIQSRVCAPTILAASCPSRLSSLLYQ